MYISNQKWKVGNHPSTVVSDTKIKNTNFPTPPNQRESGDDEPEYYGGYLICESIGNIETANLIAAAPKMLDMLIRARKEIEDISWEYIGWSDEKEGIIKEIDEVIIKALGK